MSFNIPRYKSILTSKYIGYNIHYYDVTDSTMNRAKEHVELGNYDGHIFITDEQTAGIGSVAGRTWQSNPKGNIYVTITFNYNMSITKIHPLAIASTAAVIACRSEGGNCANISIKWPNDIYYDRSKLGGMIAHVSTQDDNSVISLGIGININETFDANNIDALGINKTSTKDIKGKECDREKILAIMCNNINRLIKLSRSEVMSEYKSYLIGIGNNVMIYDKKLESKQYIIGTILDINDDFTLKIKHDNIIKDLISEEISIRL